MHSEPAVIQVKVVVVILVDRAQAAAEAARVTRATRATRPKRPRNTVGLLEVAGSVWNDKWASSADDAHYLCT